MDGKQQNFFVIVGVLAFVANTMKIIIFGSLRIGH